MFLPTGICSDEYFRQKSHETNMRMKQTFIIDTNSHFKKKNDSGSFLNQIWKLLVVTDSANGFL